MSKYALFLISKSIVSYFPPLPGSALDAIEILDGVNDRDFYTSLKKSSSGASLLSND